MIEHLLSKDYNATPERCFWTLGNEGENRFGEAFVSTGIIVMAILFYDFF